MASKYKIVLSAIDNTKKAFGSVKRNLGTVASATATTTGAIKNATVAFGLMAVAVGAVVKSSLDYADAIGKTATRTNLSVELIQALQIAFIESGASAETAEKALAKFTRSVGDAQKGLKTYSDIFADLGVQFTDNEGNFRGNEAILLDTIEAISQLNSITEKATVNANLFGRAGIILMDAFKGGSEGVKEFVARMQELGIGLDEQGVRNAERLNDSMFILSKQFNTIKDNLILGFIPVFQDVINNFQKYFHEISKTNGGLDVFAQNIAKRAIDALADFLETAGEVTMEVKKLGIRVGISQLKFENFFDTIVGYYDDFVRLPLVVGLTSEQIQGLIDLVTGGVGDLVDYTDEIRNLEAELEAVANPMADVVARLRKLRDGVGENTEAYATLTQFIEQFKKASGELDLTDQQSALDRFASTLDEEGIKLAKENMMVKAFNDAETALVDFTDTGKLSFKNMVDNMIKELIRLQIRMSIIAPFFKAFEAQGGIGKGGLLAGFGALFGSGTSTPPPKTPAGNFNPLRFEGGGFTGLGARTGGLDGRGGFPAMLHPNETVIDHHKGQQIGQQPVNVNFSIQATDASGFDEMLSARKNQIVAMISQAMNQKGKVGLI
jgi:hypothetical protein